MLCKRPLLHWPWLPCLEKVYGRKRSSFSSCGFFDWIFPYPTRPSEFPFRSDPGGNCIRESVVEREIEKERGGSGRELVNERSCVSRAQSLRSINFWLRPQRLSTFCHTSKGKDSSMSLCTIQMANLLLLLLLLLRLFSHHLGSPEWCWVSLFHWVLSSASSSFNPTLSISLSHESSVKGIYKNLGNHVRKPACTRSPTLTHARAHVHLYITGPVYRIITNTLTSLTLYCSVRFPGR